ncbi:MAG: transcription antitermination factor NusB [Thermodesulfobacteriota bacterium]
MGNRRKSRELALQILYQIDISRENARDALDLFWQNFKGLERSREFTEKLVEGVYNHKEEIDRLIEECSENWRLKRMSRVDRSILRLAIFELFYCKDVPAKVTLNEAIDLGKKFGSEKSGSFINGILDRISADIVKDRNDSRETE